MSPISEQGSGIGYSFDRFINRFVEICNEHTKDKRAQSFAFIMYDFQDDQIRSILDDQAGFAQLDRLSGKNLSIFYLHSKDRSLFKKFNDIFLGMFEIDNRKKTFPFVLFFNIIDNNITDIEIIELEQTDLKFAFKELYDLIKSHIDKVSDENSKLNIKTNDKFLKIWGAVKRIPLEKIFEWLVDKGYEAVFSAI